MQPLPTIDALIFKGTHNSYSCEGGDPPRMNHPPNEQIDEFGVWSVELDFNVILDDDGVATPVVGHNGPGDGTCWGYKLIDFLTIIRDSKAMGYRPVFIYLEIKYGDSWDDSNLPTPEQAYSYAVACVDQVFQGNYVELADYVSQHGYPTVAQVAGQAVIFYPSPEFPNSRFPPPRFQGTLHSWSFGTCTSREEIENGIDGPEGLRVLRLDQYQADWTFEYSLPPNPLVVDWTAQPPWTVTDSEGEDWGPCANGDVWRGQIVHEQGTFRFPYRTLTKAVVRAEGKPFESGNPVLNGSPDMRRTGYGWTVLIRSGNYPETLTIDIPLTLKKDDRFAGTVVIGR
jgi:hypothetical protein